MGRLKYKELANERIKEQRNIVISETYDRNDNLLGYSVAEQFVAEENGKEVKMFVKNGIGILSKGGLLNLKKAIDSALIELGELNPCKCEKKEQKDVDTEQ